LRSWLNHNGVVDIVEHCHNFVASLGITSSQTISEGSQITGRPLRPGTRTGTRPGTGLNPGMPSGIRSGVQMPGQLSNIPMQPTTGAMGPSSKSPLVWVGALIAVAVLVLAGVLVWTRITTPDAPVVVATDPKPKTLNSTAKPVTITPKPVEPKPVEPTLVTTPKPVEPEIRVGNQSPLDRKPTGIKERPKPVQPYKPPPPPDPKPEFKNPEPVKPVLPSVGSILIKSAPPFAALTINGKPQGETPMNAWMEVPVGKCHIEIVHRLTPPFDTTITVTAGSRQEFKFKLDR
jgi:PEGA domain